MGPQSDPGPGRGNRNPATTPSSRSISSRAFLTAIRSVKDVLWKEIGKGRPAAKHYIEGAMRADPEMQALIDRRNENVHDSGLTITDAEMEEVPPMPFATDPGIQNWLMRGRRRELEQIDTFSPLTASHSAGGDFFRGKELRAVPAGADRSESMVERAEPGCLYWRLAGTAGFVGNASGREKPSCSYVRASSSSPWCSRRSCSGACWGVWGCRPPSRLPAPCSGSASAP